MNKVNIICLSFSTVVRTICLQATQLWVVMNMEAMVRIWAFLQQFWCTEEAQDLIEYTIIVAVFVLASVSVIGIFMPSVKAIWSTNDSELATASSFATS